MKLAMIVFILTLSSCGNDKSHTNEVVNRSLTRVVILDKRNNLKEGAWIERFDINDEKKLDYIYQEIKKLKTTDEYISSPGNFGVISLLCYYNDQSEEELRIVYSKYHGVIIYTTNPSKSYKNDDLELVVTKYMREAKDK